MSKATRLIRCVKTVALTAVTVVAAGAAPSVAHAQPAHHYYIEIGGTGSAAPSPACTTSYGYANQHLGGGIRVPVCYPASAGPWLNGQNTPDLTAPSYDASVSQGYRNALTATENAYHKDPGARFTIVGYSQGAQAADQELKTIADGATDIPRSHVDGMLYADPMQPGTGLAAVVPKGVSALGFTSAGPGPKEFPGVPVERFCIHNDLVCDTTSLQSIYGFLTGTHGLYWHPGDVMTQTIAHDGGDGILWYAS